MACAPLASKSTGAYARFGNNFASVKLDNVVSVTSFFVQNVRNALLAQTGIVRAVLRVGPGKASAGELARPMLSTRGPKA